MIKNLIQILKNNNISIRKTDIDNFNQNSNPKDSIYPISVFIFENPKIDHNTRLKCHLELIKISKQKRCDFSIAHNLNLSSRVYSVLGFNNEAIKNDLDAIKIWKKIKNEPLAINGEISSYANLGYIYMELGLFKKALLYFEKGLESLKKCKEDLIPFIRINLGLGHVYSKLNQYRRAESYYKNALNESKKTKNPLIIIPCRVSAADMKLNYKDYDSAIEDYKKILKDITKIDDVNYKKTTLGHLGICYLKSKKYSLAKKYFKLHLDMVKNNNMIESLPVALSYLAQVYYKQKNIDKALIFFKESYDVCLEYDKLHSNYEILRYLSDIYEKKNQIKDSLSFYKKYVNQIKKDNSEKDKIYQYSKKRIINSLSLELDQIKKEKENLQYLENINLSENSVVSSALIDAENTDFLNSLIDNLNDNNFDKNKLILEIKSKINSSDHWKDYLNAFEKINKNFRIKLNKKSNQILTHTELKICSFIKIGFDNYEIAGLLSIGLRGVQQHRYRIKKKMGLKSQKLDYIISNIN